MRWFLADIHWFLAMAWILAPFGPLPLAAAGGGRDFSSVDFSSVDFG